MRSFDVKYDDFQESLFAVAVISAFPMYVVISILQRWLKGAVIDVTYFATKWNCLLLIVYVICVFGVWQKLPDGYEMLYFLLPFILVSFLESLYLSFRGEVPIEINRDLKGMPSIGEVWAISCSDYYLEVFKDFQERIKLFEMSKKAEEENIVIRLKKMIILIPLSCDADGTLDKKSSNIEYIDNLQIHTYVQGGNINRQYKNPIYNITSHLRNLYIAMEMPNTLIALKKLRKSIQEKLWRFQRNEFISTLIYRLSDQPCKILLYDDLKEGPKLPLNEFLFEEVNKLLEEELF